MIAWLVDAAAIISQKALLKCSYAPYARIMKKICWEESFHILHGRDVVLTMMTGTDEQRELVQEALDRWWGPLMQFHGNPIPAEDDPMYQWRIKSQANEEARQQFLDGYVAPDLGARPDRPRPDASQGRGDRRLALHRARLGRAEVGRHRPRPGDGAATRLPARFARGDGLGAPGGPRRRGVIWEVFRQEREGQPFQHGGSLEAPNRDVRRGLRGRVLRPPRASPSRSGSCRARRSLEIDEPYVADVFDRDYRRVDGYSLKVKLKEARERAGTT